MITVSRRMFVTGSFAGFVAPAIPTRPAAGGMLQWMDGGLPASFPTQDPDTVLLVVAKSHVDYDTVRTVVTARPQLAKAAWDWGFGDWESALGAASHMGRRDIAEVLMEHGARPNHFTFAMLDHVDVVRAVCESRPGVQRLHGPHGITLLQHAKHGKAGRVIEYLETLGDADIGQVNEPLDEQTAQAYVGDYVPDGAPEVVFRIGFHERQNVLTFQRDDRQFRFLMHVGNHAFNPGGAATVRIAFDVRAGRGMGLSIRDGDLMITARRIS